jgi:hypothetical protein
MFCPLCDEQYTPADAARHEHREPLSGAAREAWIRSRLAWSEFERREFLLRAFRSFFAQLDKRDSEEATCRR